MSEALKEKTTTALNSLIIINNDRYEGYKTAASETKEADLKALFTKYSTQSQAFNLELKRLLPDFSDAPDHGETTISGKLYRIWMDVKSALSTDDRKAVLASCEFGEDVALSTYRDALEEGEIEMEVRNVISKQKQELQEAHDRIKMLRDSAR